MSVDSFIQQRISLDASSTSEHSSAATTPHRTTFRTASSSHSNPSSKLTSGSSAAEPAVDPRWQMVPGGADAQHAFFKSIESELPETDRIAIHHGFASLPSTSASPTPPAGYSTSQQQHHHDSGGGSSKRHSMLRGKSKHSAKLPIGSGGTNGGGVLNASASTISSATSGGYAIEGGGRAASSSISSTRRPAVSSAGIQHPPTSSSSANNVSNNGTTSSGRRVNAPGPINVTRGRTYSLGNSNSTNNANATSGTAPSTATASSSSYHPPPPLRLATGDYPISPLGEGDAQPGEDISEYCIGIVGARGCGKSLLIRKVVKRYKIVEEKAFHIGDIDVPSTTVHVDVSDNARPQSVRILEVDSALVAHPDNLWPAELPRVDGVLLCYDAANEDSFTRIPELLAGYCSLGHALVILACKSDLHRSVSPSRANEIGKKYDIGLIEVSTVTEVGKTKIRNCFVWEIKAIGRHRRNAAKNSIPPYRNPASPEILQTSRGPWDSNNGTPTAASTPGTSLLNHQHRTQGSSSQSSLASGTQLFRNGGQGGSANSSAPVLPLLDTYPHSSSISHHSTGGTGTGTSSLNGNDRDGMSPSVPSTARTSFDSVILAAAGAAGALAANQPQQPPPQQQHQRPPSSSSGPPPRTRSTSDVLSTSAKIPLIPTSSPAPATGTSTMQRNMSSTSVTRDLDEPPPGGATSPQVEVGSGPGTAVPAGGGSGPVAEGTRQQREGSSLQWATLDEILDKLLFVSVSGDDPVFIQHFFLTYRRFATPRSVLLGMQKRMIELGKETRDPLLAKFAQMRICNLLSQWKENYPNDFGAPGTFGALQALLKQVVSNVHLVHYASDLIPFLDEVPKLEDRESTWCKKEETVSADDSEDESANGTDDENEIIPRLDDDEDTYVGRGDRAFERRTRVPASSNPSAPQGRSLAATSSGAERPYHAAGSNSAPNVATIASSSISDHPGSSPLPPIPTRSAIPFSSASGYERETVFTFDKEVGRNARVNVKELQRVAHAVMQLETVHLAQEITRRMLILFKRIEARDWLRRTMSKKDYPRDKDPIGQLTRLFNYLVCWVSATIVSFDRVSQRAKVIDKMVVIAKALRQLNNYMGMNAFVAGINNVRGADEEELTQMMASRPNSNWKQFKSLQVLVGTARSGQTYRTALKHTPGAAIPDLERHGSDIFRAEEGNLDYSRTDPNLIHWGKFTILGKLVGTVTLYQNRCHTMADYRDLEERPLISDLVFNQVVWDLETLTNREHRAWEEAQTTTESSSGLRRLLPFKV